MHGAAAPAPMRRLPGDTREHGLGAAGSRSQARRALAGSRVQVLGPSHGCVALATPVGVPHYRAGMAFLESMAMRSCGHCGLKRAHMDKVGEANPATSRRVPRWFSFLACPDCASITVIEHNGPVSTSSSSTQLLSLIHI